MPYTDNASKVLTFIKKASRTRKQIQEHFGFSQSYAGELITELRSQLFIIDYERPEGKGRPSPKYSFKVYGDEQDVVLEKKPRTVPASIPAGKKKAKSKPKDRSEYFRLYRKYGGQEAQRRASLSPFRILTGGLEETPEQKRRKKRLEIARKVRQKRRHVQRVYDKLRYKFGTQEDWPEEARRTYEALKVANQPIYNQRKVA